MQKHNTKKQEQEIIVLVKKYKMMICNQIKEGTKISGLTIKHVFWNEAGGCIEWDLGNGSWIKFRISGTEPKFKIYINLVIESKKVYYNFDQVQEFTNNLVKNIKGKLSK